MAGYYAWCTTPIPCVRPKPGSSFPTQYTQFLVNLDPVWGKTAERARSTLLRMIYATLAQSSSTLQDLSISQSIVTFVGTASSEENSHA